MSVLSSNIFWSAFGALVAFAALLVTIGGTILAVLRRNRSKKLQTILDRERKFYEQQARRVTPTSVVLPEESAIETYLHSIEEGLLTIGNLTNEKRDKTKDKIRELLNQLRATHKTLVESLELFMTNSAETFFREFDKFNQKFGSLYHSGVIPHDARTHCGEVVETVDKIVEDISGNSETDAPETRDKIQRIARSMEYADQETIVPIMIYVLSRTEIELSLISSTIREGDKHKAIWLKERYRFEIEKLYQRLNDGLNRMSDLASKL